MAKKIAKELTTKQNTEIIIKCHRCGHKTSLDDYSAMCYFILRKTFCEKCKSKINKDK